MDSSLSASPRLQIAGRHYRIESLDYSAPPASVLYKGTTYHLQDYSAKPPSSTDKRLSSHPALQLRTINGWLIPFPLDKLVRLGLPGGSRVRKNVIKAFASLTISSHPTARTETI